jgi:hypothetical protein
LNFGFAVSTPHARKREYVKMRLAVNKKNGGRPTIGRSGDLMSHTARQNIRSHGIITDFDSELNG